MTTRANTFQIGTGRATTRSIHFTQTPDGRPQGQYISHKHRTGDHKGPNPTSSPRSPLLYYDCVGWPSLSREGHVGYLLPGRTGRADLSIGIGLQPTRDPSPSFLRASAHPLSMTLLGLTALRMTGSW